MKIALITDSHAGAKNDSPMFHEYTSKFFKNVFFPHLVEHNIKTLIHLGDIVDRRKFINYKTLKDFRENFVFKLWDLKIDTHVILGNHDIFHKNNSDVNAMQELFRTYDGQTEPWIYSGPTEKVFDGLPILFLPWINESNYDISMETIKKTRAEIIMGHLEVAGFQMHRGAPNMFGFDASIFDRFDKVMSGHYHHRSNNGTIYYLGAPYEMSWSDFQDDRGFHIFDTETRNLEYIRNPYRMYHKIFYNDKDKTFDEVLSGDFSFYENTCIKVVIQEKTNPHWFNMLMDKLYKQNPFSLTIVEDYLEDLNNPVDITIDQTKDTLEILKDYINTLDTKQDKEKITNFISALYEEAVSNVTEED